MKREVSGWNLVCLVTGHLQSAYRPVRLYRHPSHPGSSTSILGGSWSGKTWQDMARHGKQGIIRDPG